MCYDYESFLDIAAEQIAGIVQINKITLDSAIEAYLTGFMLYREEVFRNSGKSFEDIKRNLEDKVRRAN